MVIMCGIANSINDDVHSVMAQDLIRLGRREGGRRRKNYLIKTCWSQNEIKV